MEETRKRHFLLILVDMTMLAILTVNLTWIVFDALFGIALIQAGLKALSSRFVELYQPVHRDFFFYDLAFISFYITELLIQWALAIKRRTYHRWFFYPFIHWYDVIGCIPVETFRFVRIFRVISILFRLQKLGYFDLRNTFIYRALAKYYGIFTEEISDRVVVNVLEEVQSQIRQGSPVLDKIGNQVIKARQPEMVKWFSGKMQHVVKENYGEIREDLRAYVDLRVRQAVEKNRELTTIKRTVPVLGGLVIKNMERIVADVVFQAINGLAEDISSNSLEEVFDQIADILLGAMLTRGEDQQLNQVVIEAMVASLEIVKEQVRVQQWKLRENALQEVGLEG